MVNFSSLNLFPADRVVQDPGLGDFYRGSPNYAIYGGGFSSGDFSPMDASVCRRGGCLGAWGSGTAPWGKRAGDVVPGWATNFAFTTYWLSCFQLAAPPDAGPPPPPLWRQQDRPWGGLHELPSGRRELLSPPSDGDVAAAPSAPGADGIGGREPAASATPSAAPSATAPSSTGVQRR